jgi:hypothetical protein
LTLSLRDSASIAALFRLRPATVIVSAQSRYDKPSDDRPVRVRYIAPRLPTLSRTARAAAERTRREWLASYYRSALYIADDEYWHGPLWLSVGDSVTLHVQAMHCQSDVCSGSPLGLADARWAVGDSAVLTLRPSPPRNPLEFGRARRWAVATREGRTAIYLTGSRHEADSARAADDSAATTREVVVTRPVSGIRITPRPETISAGDSTTAIGAQVFGTAGDTIAGAPVRYRVMGPGQHSGYNTNGPIRPSFEKPGAYTIIATFLGHADTLRVVVRP